VAAIAAALLGSAMRPENDAPVPQAA
jgi:hypothetical protein